MSEYVDVTEFDLNDPALADFAPEFSDDQPENLPPPPPSKGFYDVICRLDEKWNEGNPVYLKDVKKDLNGKVVSGKVVATLNVRFWNAEKQAEGGFLERWWLTTTQMGPLGGASLPYFMKLAGEPIPAGSGLLRIKELVENFFARNREKGVPAFVEVDWVKSVVQTEYYNGIYVPKVDPKTNKKLYTTVHGEELIKKAATLEAVEEVKNWPPVDGEPADAFEERKRKYIEAAPFRAHIYRDPVAGKAYTVRCEVLAQHDRSEYVFEE